MSWPSPLSRTMRTMASNLSAYPWHALITNQGVEVGESGDQLVAVCPFCRHHRTSFYLSPEKGLWICKFCGRKGNGPKLISLLLGVSYRHAAELLEGRSIPYATETEEREKPTIQLPEEYEPLELPEHVGNKRFWRYARRRRLTLDLVEAYDVGFCRSGLYGGRLIIPFYWKDELVSFFARDITNKLSRKVMTPFGGKQGQFLFNLDRLNRKDVIAVEGAFDCLVLPSRAFASSGKRLNNTQLIQLVQHGGIELVYLCWDEDAVRDASEMTARLSTFVDVKLVLLPMTDPSHLGRDAVLRAVAAAERTTATTRARLQV